MSEKKRNTKEGRKMANQHEADLEKQFQSDLEKAAALSLETLALEQFKRSKIHYSHSDLSANRSGGYKTNNGEYILNCKLACRLTRVA